MALLAAPVAPHTIIEPSTASRRNLPVMIRTSDEETVIEARGENENAGLSNDRTGDR
ncbi:MAG: hypothetical protein AAGI54_03255 [Planctomycetota bacterium]